jgi:ABC-type branched-subunit amino acid transport system substrate-binding protein
LRELAQDVLDGLRMAVQFPSDAADPAHPPRLDVDLAPVREGVKDKPAPARPRRVELVIRDTANNPRRAAQMAESLVKDDQVIAIVGPLARNESEAAALKAEELSVPLVSLSLSMDLPPGGRFSFRNSKSQEDEVRDLVWYAHDYLEARRFAILYPDTAYGQRMLELFWDEVRRKGGEVIGAAPFVPQGARPEGGRRSLGLKEIFDAFTGVDRMLSPEDLKLLAAVGDSRADPIVDFDALYIPLGPDAAQDLRLIAPYPVTVDAESVQLLGNRFWNDDAIPVVGGPRLEGAVFVDVYDRSSGNPRMAEFQGLHRALFAHRASYQSASYYTALGYDTIQMLLEQLKDPASRSRAGLARGLKLRPAFAGVTGLTSFRASGEAVKESAFFRIRGGEVIKVGH